MALDPLLPDPPADPFPLLALDLSTAAVGWASIRYPGASAVCSSARPVLGMRPDTPTNRLLWLGDWFAEHLVETIPRLVVVESPDLEAAGLRTRPATLKALYSALGVVLECCRRADVTMRGVDARRVRERLVGRATASKAEAQAALRQRGYVLPMRGGKVDHDAADALALGVVCVDELAMLAAGRG